MIHVLFHSKQDNTTIQPIGIDLVGSEVVCRSVFNRISGMPLEALALERMNDRHKDNDCGCVIILMQVWRAELCPPFLKVTVLYGEISLFKEGVQICGM